MAHRLRPLKNDAGVRRFGEKPDAPQQERTGRLLSLIRRRTERAGGRSKRWSFGMIFDRIAPRALIRPAVAGHLLPQSPSRDGRLSTPYAGEGNASPSRREENLESGRQRADIGAGRGRRGHHFLMRPRIDRRRPHPDDRSRKNAELRGRRFAPAASDGSFGLFRPRDLCPRARLQRRRRLREAALRGARQARADRERRPLRHHHRPRPGRQDF